MRRPGPRTIHSRVMVIFLFACAGPSADKRSVANEYSDTFPSTEACDGLTPLVVPDAEAAERGLARLQEGLGQALFPRVALDWLWLVWGEGVPTDEAQYQADFRERYGLAEAPFDNDGYPLGLHAVDSTWATVDCLLCHADTVAGVTVLGAANSRLDIEGLFTDFLALNEVAGGLGLPTVDLPYSLEGRTGAAGATDAFGLGMELSLFYAPDAEIQTSYGYQQSAPWGTMAYKDPVYADGAGDASGHRTMAAMMLGFGVPLSTIQSMDDDLADVRQAQLGMAPPAWPFDPPDVAEVAAGQTVYETACAACHGSVCQPGAPELVDAAGVGTDPTRAAAFGEREAAWVNRPSCLIRFVRA